MQSIDSLRELNTKLLAKIAELRKKNAEIPELREKLLKFAEVEAENARLKQIIEENARRDAKNAELKSRVGELEPRLALLEQESCDMEELKYDLHDEVIAKLDKNIIVEQELKQQLSSPAHTSTSEQTSEE
ncbi:unnamed protein product [Rhizophagus irregularis]|nr:unnamed protein product [Rhizophagus irregularis]